MSRRFWTNHGIALLVREYESRGAAWCAERLGCNVRRVRDKASNLGIKTKFPRGVPFRRGADERRHNLHNLQNGDAEIARIVDAMGFPNANCIPCCKKNGPVFRGCQEG